VGCGQKDARTAISLEQRPQLEMLHTPFRTVLKVANQSIPGLDAPKEPLVKRLRHMDTMWREQKDAPAQLSAACQNHVRDGVHVSIERDYCRRPGSFLFPTTFRNEWNDNCGWIAARNSPADDCFRRCSAPQYVVAPCWLGIWMVTTGLYD
jgi:hypothetical protein